MKITNPMILIASLAASVAYAGYVVEDFERYPDGAGLTTFWLDTWEGGRVGVNVAETTAPDVNNPPATITNKAAYFNLNSENLNPNDGDWIYFGTAPNEGARTGNWMQFDIAFKAVGAITPELIDEVWYYFFADSTGDGNADTYFETQVASGGSGALADPAILQTYPRRYMAGDLADEWDQYDTSNWNYTGTVTGMSSALLQDIKEVGFWFGISPFDDQEQTSYMTVWVDNAILIPEPSSLLILMGGIALLSRRGRRPTQSTNRQ